MYLYTNIDSMFPIQAKQIVEEVRRIAQTRGETQALDLIKVKHIVKNTNSLLMDERNE